MLKDKLFKALTETIEDLDNNDKTVKSIDNFIKNLDDRPLHSFNSSATLTDIRTYVLGEDQNTYLDFLVLLNTKLFINEVTDTELMAYLNSLINIYPEKINNAKDSVPFIINQEFKDEAVSGVYGENMDRLYSLITLLRLHTTTILPRLKTKFQGS